jgi:hypothetical protein
MRVLTFSQVFPANHPRKGMPTFFVDQILLSLGQSLKTISDHVKPLVNDFYMLDGTGFKHHTIRASSRWKAGDMFSARVWSGLPYRSKQVEFAQIEVKEVIPVKIEWRDTQMIISTPSKMPGYDSMLCLGDVAENDGLSIEDFRAWFAVHPKAKQQVFIGQIISWRAGLYS